MQETTKTKATAKSNLKILIVLLLLLAIITTGILVGYNYWSRYVQENSVLNNKVSDLGSKLDSTHAKVDNYFDQQPTEAPLTDTSLVPVKTALILTQLAEEKLRTTKDVSFAQHLLRAAQDNLATVNDPQLVHVKAMLTADQTKLSAINYIDTSALSLKVDELQNLLASMPFKGAVEQTRESKSNTQADLNASKWQQVLQSVMHEAKSVVKVRQISEVEASMTQISKDVQSAQISLLVSQMRWALFYRDAVVYQRSLQQLTTLVPFLYETNNSNVLEFQRILAELTEVQIQPEVPDIQDTVKALQAILVR